MGRRNKNNQRNRRARLAASKKINPLDEESTSVIELSSYYTPETPRLGENSRSRRCMRIQSSYSISDENSTGNMSVEDLCISSDLSKITSPLAISFRIRIENLNLQFKRLVKERDNLQQQFTTDCGESLKLAMEHLKALVEHVTVVDKSLIFWYQKGKPLRLVLKTLKPLGYDRDAKTIMVKKGDGIRQKADQVSIGFESVSDVCFSALKGVQSLQLSTNDFVESGIGGALEEADDLKRDNKRKQENLQLDIDKKELDVSRVRSEAASNRAMANELERQKEKANSASDKSAALGAVGGIGAVMLGIGCLLFPPAGAIAAGIGAVGAGVVGVSSAVVASEHTDDARRLGLEESSFRRRVSGLESDIASFKSDIEDLETAQDDYERATEAIKTLEKQCHVLRSQTNVFLKELNIARIVISEAVTKTQTIASALQRCEYARTRGDFVDRIRGVIEDLRKGTGNRVSISEGTLDLVEGQLIPLQRNTYRVAGILSKAFRNGKALIFIRDTCLVSLRAGNNVGNKY